MPLLQQTQEKYAGRGLALITVDVAEPAATVQPVVDSKGLTFQVLLDTKSAIKTQYAVPGYPMTFFIDKTGQITDIRLGAFSSMSQIDNYLAKIVN